MPALNRLVPALGTTLTLWGATVRAAAAPHPAPIQQAFQTVVPAPAGLPAAADFGAMIDHAFFLKLGFSFMVGLAVGYALKVAFKIALVVIGVILLGIFGLQYAGVAHVDWSGVEVHYNSFSGWLSANGGAFLDFVGNNLSNSVSFLAGLGLGLKL